VRSESSGRIARSRARWLGAQRERASAAVPPAAACAVGIPRQTCAPSAFVNPTTPGQLSLGGGIVRGRQADPAAPEQEPNAIDGPRARVTD
jgi:hypothetical protein